MAHGFDSWDQNKKIAWLIDSLEEVDARQWGQPGGVPLGMDRRVAALIEIGDPAVPALIDAVEKDGRLTRSVHFSRDFSRDRTVLSVREAALTAVMSILKVRVFEPASTGDNFTARGEDTAVKTAQRLREYWKTYGGLPFDERMMKTLADPKATSRRSARRPTIWEPGRETDADHDGLQRLVWNACQAAEPGRGQVHQAHGRRSHPCGHGSRPGPPRRRPAGPVVRLPSSAN